MLICCPHCQKEFDLWGALNEGLKGQLTAVLTSAIKERLEADQVDLRQKITTDVLNDYMLKDREKDALIADLRTNVENLRRRLTQSSQQVQGEVFETALVDALKQAFPSDEITRIGKGRNGGDVLQVMRDPAGTSFGRVLWETKNTRAFCPKWVAKLKEDAIRSSADLAVILSKSLPRDVQNFGQVDGIWVTDYASHLGLALALRCQLAACFEYATQRGADANELKAYIRSTEFHQRVELIFSSIKSLRDQLGREQQVVGRWWAERDKLINSVSQHLAAVTGGLETVAGCSFRATVPVETSVADPDLTEETVA